MATGIAYIGCGYVADLYHATMSNAEGQLVLHGVFDKEPTRSQAFSEVYGVKVYHSYDDVLKDPKVDIVVNLTNPKDHYGVSLQALRAGKHVYSEKPLALDLAEAEDLVMVAKEVGREIVCAPSSVLGEAAQTMIKAVKDRKMGEPRLVYAEIDDGQIHRIGMENWKSMAGIPWPCKDELETGCTLEHAGYVLSWLVAMFGPARRVVSFAELLIKDRGAFTPENYSTPDFSCACVEFDGGIVARITNSIVAPHDHRFRVFCDEGHLELAETWDFEAKVYAVPIPTTRLKRQLEKKLGWTGRHEIKPVRKRKIVSAKQGYHIDFMIGIVDMAQALAAGRSPRLAGEFSLHITELSLAIQYPDKFGSDYTVKSAPAKPPPMSWAAKS